MKIFGERRNNDILMFYEMFFFCFYYIRLVYILDGWMNVFFFCFFPSLGSTSTYFPTYVKYQETGYKGWQKANRVWVGVGLCFLLCYKIYFLFVRARVLISMPFNKMTTQRSYRWNFLFSILIFNGIFYCFPSPSSSSSFFGP